MLKKCASFKRFLSLQYLVHYATPLIIVCLVFVAPGCTKSQDESMKGKEEKSTEKTTQGTSKQESKQKLQLPKPAESEEATLTLVNLSQNTFGIDLKNNAPVRLIQFTVTGIENAQVRSTTRTNGFLIKFTKTNNKVTILSPSGNTINPGSGLIAEMSCDAATAALSEIMIAK